MWCKHILGCISVCDTQMRGASRHTNEACANTRVWPMSSCHSYWAGRRNRRVTAVVVGSDLARRRSRSIAWGHGGRHDRSTSRAQSCEGEHASWRLDTARRRMVVDAWPYRDECDQTAVYEDASTRRSSCPINTIALKSKTHNNNTFVSSRRLRRKGFLSTHSNKLVPLQQTCTITIFSASYCA
jgi:hypothetical protein